MGQEARSTASGYVLIRLTLTLSKILKFVLIYIRMRLLASSKEILLLLVQAHEEISPAVVKKMGLIH